MNPNRQNNCFTPAGTGCSRQTGRTANVITNTPCGTASCGCSALCGNAGTASGIVTGNCQNPGCNRETALSGMPIAMAYVPWQNYGSIYSLPQALQSGTLFCELNLDFAGRRCN